MATSPVPAGRSTWRRERSAATDCRRAFPCWDEPDFKAVPGVTLDVADGLLAISNAPEVSREPGADGRVRVRFDDTMLMSTYLAAFVVGPLVATDPVDVGHHVPPERLHVGQVRDAGADAGEVVQRQVLQH